MYGLPDIRLVGTDLLIPRLSFPRLSRLSFRGSIEFKSREKFIARRNKRDLFFFNCNESIRIKNSNILSFKHYKNI